MQRLAKQLQLYKPVSVNEEAADQNSNFGSMESTAEETEQSGGGCRRKNRAAVLICLFEGHDGEIRVILTKRSMNLSSHPGDVALPGGKMEEGDVDDAATALREAMEEIGLDPDLVQVVTALEPFSSQNQLSVVPVIGLLANIDEFKPALNSDEVDIIFYAPLEIFLQVLQEEKHRSEEREWMGWKYSVHHFDFKLKEEESYDIWGLTASILIRAASIIYQTSSCFHSNLPDFQQLQRAFKDLASP